MSQYIRQRDQPSVFALAQMMDSTADRMLRIRTHTINRMADQGLLGFRQMKYRGESKKMELMAVNVVKAQSGMSFLVRGRLIPNDFLVGYSLNLSRLMCLTGAITALDDV